MLCAPCHQVVADLEVVAGRQLEVILGVELAAVMAVEVVDAVLADDAQVLVELVLGTQGVVVDGVVVRLASLLHLLLVPQGHQAEAARKGHGSVNVFGFDFCEHGG